MAASSIQEQCHRYLVAEEERRCQALDAQRCAEKGARARPVKRNVIPLPQVRSGPAGLCNDRRYLLMIDEFDYDLENPAFLSYCEIRGSQNLANPGSRRWHYLVDTSRTWEQFSTDLQIATAEGQPGRRAYKFTREELSSQWLSVRLARASLQDSWELFQKT